jgi:hypothetical protein
MAIHKLGWFSCKKKDRMFFLGAQARMVDCFSSHWLHKKEQGDRPNLLDPVYFGKFPFFPPFSKSNQNFVWMILGGISTISPTFFSVTGLSCCWQPFLAYKEDTLRWSQMKKLWTRKLCVSSKQTTLLFRSLRSEVICKLQVECTQSDIYTKMSA